MKKTNQPPPEKILLDVCCGTKMMWVNRKNPAVIFGDIRQETIKIKDRSHGKTDGTRTLSIEPDTLLDFRNLPYKNDSFWHVLFDPPHLIRAGQKSWLAAKYGVLKKDWRDDLKQGFEECLRVLKPHGTLVFKWSEVQIKVGEVLALAPQPPAYGQVSGRGHMTHWLVFIKI